MGSLQGFSFEIQTRVNQVLDLAPPCTHCTLTPQPQGYHCLLRPHWSTRLEGRRNTDHPYHSLPDHDEGVISSSLTVLQWITVLDVEVGQVGQT